MTEKFIYEYIYICVCVCVYVCKVGTTAQKAREGKEEIFRLLELDHSESESPSSSSDNEIHQLDQSSSSRAPFSFLLRAILEA